MQLLVLVLVLVSFTGEAVVVVADIFTWNSSKFWLPLLLLFLR